MGSFLLKRGRLCCAGTCGEGFCLSIFGYGGSKSEDFVLLVHTSDASLNTCVNRVCTLQQIPCDARNDKKE